MKKTPLARRNLLHDKLRMLVATAGVTFAVVLVLMQLGFYGAVKRTATTIYDQLDFDVLLLSPDYLHLSKAGTLPLVRLVQAERVEGVESVRPLYLGFNLWLNRPAGRRTQAERRGILIMAFPLDRPAFRRALGLDLAVLRVPGHVLMDRRSRSEFQPWHVGWETEVGRMRIRVAGTFELGTGFGADGALIASDETFRRMFAGRPLDRPSLGLIKLREPAQAEAVAARLRAIYPPRGDVRVMTRRQIEAAERRHWLEKTSVGFIFFLGVIVGLIVGTAIVYQVLASDIANHLAEYATLKAMGYSHRFLAGVVLQQALLLAVAGFVPGVLLAWLLYEVTRAGAHIPMQLTLGTAALVFVLTLGMCMLSGLLSMRKVFGADPADLF